MHRITDNVIPACLAIAPADRSRLWRQPLFEASWIIAELMNELACSMLPRMIRQTASLAVNMARQLLLGSERQCTNAPNAKV